MEHQKAVSEVSQNLVMKDSVHYVVERVGWGNKVWMEQLKLKIKRNGWNIAWD